ncbi:hypothetical protein DSECCO2_93200 [anaerobic digester metagenome]
MNQESDKKFECIKGIMAFVDFLGLSNFLKVNTPMSNADNEKIDRLNAQIHFFESSLGHHGRFAEQTEKYQLKYDGGVWGAISYSDNASIFISGEGSENPNLTLTNLFEILLAQLAYSQYESASDWKYDGFENFLIRGGITYGYGYIGKNIVTGPAHLHAFNIEQSDPYPRIVIDKKIFDNIDITRLEKNFIIRDFYGTFFVDYLKAFNPDLLYCLEHVRDFILENLKSTKGSILQKYQWTARYFNYHCHRSNLNDLLIPEFEDYDKCFTKDFNVV